METYENLEVFKESHLFVVRLYKIVKDFPKEEKFRLSDQLCRAVVSIPSNIAEGYGRFSIREKVRFLYMARGSIEEVKYQLLLAKDLQYINSGIYKELSEQLNCIGKMLNGLITSLKARQPDNQITR